MSNLSLQTNAEKVFDILSSAVDTLELVVSKEHLKFMTEILLQSMGGPRRSFHTLTHTLNVCKSKDPIEVIAGLFHDAIYVEVDQAVILNAGRFISPYIEERQQKLFIIESIGTDHHPLFKIILDIFGLKPGDQLQPFGGQNEFLSALLACKLFENVAPLALLAKITLCIGATIPFKPLQANDASYSEILLTRLSKLNQELNLSIDTEELIECVKRSVRLSNRDVESFSSEQSSQFLDETWNLLPETNHSLLRANTYTIKQYRISLQKMTAFLNFLSPDLVYRRFLDEPSQEKFEYLNKRAKHNIEIARLYLSTKLTSIGVLEALSLRLGNDVSVSMMMGELSHAASRQHTMANFLPIVETSYAMLTPEEKEVMSLLEEGRYLNSAYDLKNSPTTAFMLKAIGFQNMKLLLPSVMKFFSDEMTPEGLIAECPPAIVKGITEAVVSLFAGRIKLLV